jgi:excisionase family DNA binding protein
MPYKLNKIIFQKDNIQDYETHTRQLNTEIDNPFIAGKLQEMFPEDNQYGNILELSTSLLFNESGLTKLIPEVGPKGIYYLELKPGHKLKQLVVEPEDVVVDIYFGREDTLIYSFYNPTRRKSIAITASIEKDTENIYTKLKSDPEDIHWRQHFIRRALAEFNKEGLSPLKKEYPENMTAVQVADYLQVEEKTIRNWTSQGKIPSVRISGIVRYKKSDIEQSWEKKGSTRKNKKS